MRTILIIVSGLSFVYFGYILGSQPIVAEQISPDVADSRPERRAKPSRKQAKSTPKPIVSSQAETKENIPPRNFAMIQSDIKAALDNPSGREILKASMGILQLDAREIEDLLKNPELSKLKTSDYEHSDILAACFARLAEIDPQNAVSLIESIDISLQDRAMKTIFKEWGGSDSDAAVAASIEIENPKHKQTALVQIINGVAETDLEKALELALEHDGHRSPLSDTFSHIILKMAATDPLLALEKSDNIPFKGIKSRAAKDARERGIMLSWSANDPDAALAHILKSEGKSDKALFTMDLVKMYTLSDPEKAFELLAAGKSVISGSRLKIALSGLAKKDPQRALSWVNATYSGEKKDDLFRSSISSWYAEDEAAALTYFEGIQDPELKKVVSSGILSKFRYSDPDKFLELYPSMNSGSDYDKGAFSVTLRNLSVKDPAKAKQYLDAIIDPELKAQALAPYLTGLLRSDPDQSFEIAGKVQDREDREALQGDLYPYLALRKPSLVADVFIENGFQDVGSYEFNKFISTYAGKDIAQASEIVNTMKDGDQRDSAIQLIIPKFEDTDRGISLEWANSITNPDLRITTMKSTYDNWRKRDPEKANEWLQSTELYRSPRK